MPEMISVFAGIAPAVKMAVEWKAALSNIRSGKYKNEIDKCRAAVSIRGLYDKLKVRLPAVTFGGTFEMRRANNAIDQPTGFIVADLDHLHDVDKLFNMLLQDEYVWFAFRSPSGEGIKAGIRSEGINCDADHKKLYAAIDQYFNDTYGIKIDAACKDISRLTFMSHDPGLYINESALWFPLDEWIVERPQQQYFIHASTDNGWKDKYGRKVLESSCLKIQQSPPGQQHSARIAMARLIGGYIASGFIQESVAIPALESAVIASNAKDVQKAMKDIRDGIEYGKLAPAYPAERPENKRNNIKDVEFDLNEPEPPSNQSNQCNQSNQSNLEGDSVIKVISCNHPVIKVINEDDHPAPQNLHALIKDWVLNSGGYFTSEQIDREFCLTTRKEKVSRAVCLARLKKNNLIDNDRRMKGRFQVLSDKIEWIDPTSTAEEETFDIRLPFDLHRHVVIAPKSIIVLAGSTNAGKTAIILNTIRLNLEQRYEKMYLMSEMGEGMYMRRIKSFGLPIEKWKSVKAASKSSGFNAAIKHHNPHGLTAVDFLEEVDGEYFMIPSQIRSIYDSLGTGVAMIAIQKHSQARVARGGEGTMEKSQLYMTLDHICTMDHSVICALRITKLKCPVDRNMQDHEIHFSISNGCKLDVVMDWTPSWKVDRDACRSKYQAPVRKYTDWNDK